jgi:magnesium transporter
MQKRYSLVGERVLPSEDPAAPITVFNHPTDAEKKYLVNELKIDEHTLASALDPDELSRLEFEPDHKVILFNRPKSYAPTKRRSLGIGSAGLFLYDDRMVVVMSSDDTMLDGLASFKITDFNSLALRLIYRSIYHFLEHLRIISQLADEIQDKLASSMENKYLLKMFELQRSMVYYQVSITSNQAMIEKLKNNTAKFGFTPEEIELLDDMSIENVQCGKQAEINSNILAGLMDARASIVNNNLNILIKMLNLITIGIMVPTLVVSAFSMNVPIPLAQHPWAFWAIMAMALTSVALLVAYLRWKRW